MVDILLFNSNAAKKHTPYICHAQYVPRWYIIIKIWCATKHTLHACYTEYVPRGYVIIKCWRRSENITDTRSTKFNWKVVADLLNKMVIDWFDLSNYANIYIAAKTLYHNSQPVNTSTNIVVTCVVNRGQLSKQYHYLLLSLPHNPRSGPLISNVNTKNKLIW